MGSAAQRADGASPTSPGLVARHPVVAGSMAQPEAQPDLAVASTQKVLRMWEALVQRVLVRPLSRTAQKELLLQADVIKGLKLQGFYVDKMSDRFKAGVHDLRIGRFDTGQLDVELKYNTLSLDKLGIDPDVSLLGVPMSLLRHDLPEFDTGMTKLQWLKLRDKNEHGMPSVCLVYFEALDYFGVTTLLRETLPPLSRRVLKLPRPKVVDGVQLIRTARSHLSELGYLFQT